MFGLQWSERTSAKASQHPMGDAAAAAQLVGELPFGSPGSVVAEASAWLESVEAETTFTPAHRLKVVLMIDDAVHGSAEELTLTYAGVGRGAPGQAADWRALMKYLDRLGGAYRTVIDACAGQRSHDVGANLPAIICRMMRAVASSMKIGWMRYLPPDRASWETLVHAYRTAQAHNCAETLVTVHASDGERTCPLYEFTVAVMLTAAAPQSLTPRRVELIHRITSAYRASFTVNTGRTDQWRHYLVDLDQPGPPARVPEQVCTSKAVLFFRAEKVLEPLKRMLDRGRAADTAITAYPFGPEFATSEKLNAIDHVMQFWDDSPPARRDGRTPINTAIKVELGVRSIQRALEDAEDPLGAAAQPLILMGEDPGQDLPPEKGTAAVLNTWTLTDFSSRGIGARCTRRLDLWLRVGTVIGFRLERSDKWCVAIVRRLKTDTRNQTDVGAEILAKSACLVTLEGLSSAGTLSSLSGGGPVVHSRALMLPEDPQFGTRASLFFEPGTNALEQTFVLHQGSSARRIRLHEAAESLDGWERVEFDWLD